MKERPILMNGAMVRAVLDGSKTQTRRLVKGFQIPKFDHASSDLDHAYWAIAQNHPRWGFCVFGSTEQKCADQLAQSRCCPYGQVGDQLWVRETFSDVYGNGGNEEERLEHVMYRVDGDTDPYLIGGRWTPSIHMPRWASRIQLEITSVRVEQLQDIIDADILAEGIDTERMAEMQDSYDMVCAGPDFSGRATLKSMWRDLWESTGGDWEANPWVWAISFKRVTA